MPAGRPLVMQHLFGFFPSQVVYAAATLGIADHLAAGAASAADVAAAAGCDAGNTGRLLRAMVFLGLVDEPEPGRYALNEEGAVLQSMRNWVRLFASTESWRSWGELTGSVRTGKVAWDELFGMSTFEYMAAHPEFGQVFNEAMAEGTRQVVPAIVGVIDLSTPATVVDIGGGNGALLAALLVTNPQARGVVFDTPTGVGEAAGVLAEAGVGDRGEVVAGDFFVSVPPHADVYVLKSVIHDWDDERATAILRNCRRAIGGGEGGRLLLVEPIMPALMTTEARLFGMVMSDLNMMVVAGGRERTEDEFGALLAAAGFRLTGVTPCGGATTYQVLEAAPVVEPSLGIAQPAR